MNLSRFTRYIFDARLVILFFFLIRLFGITNPPLERNHNWRQVTTNMYARNFLEIDNDIRYARVDMAGDLTGITAKEFPLFNYMIYGSAKIFGWQHWYGRLINLIVSSFGAYFFYLLIKEYLSDEWDFPAMLVLLAGIWFGHSRIIMPDTFAVSLVLGGLYYGLKYLDKGKWWRLFLFFFLATMGALSKLPAGYLLAILVLPIFGNQKHFPSFEKLESLNSRKTFLSIFGAALLFICGYWYFYWLPHLVETYGYEHYPMRDIWTGAKEIFSDLGETAERFYISAPKSYVAFGAYIFGLGHMVWKRPRRLCWIFGVLSALFILYMFKAGASFYHHNYYIIPFAPLMALVAGYGLRQIPWSKFRWLLIVAILAEGIGNQQDAFRIKKSELPKLELENIADSISEKNDLVAFYHQYGNPQEMYFAHRKGWMSSAKELKDSAYRKMLREKGCRFIFINKKKWPGGKLKEDIVFENKYYWVYGIR